jgi:NhaP-type Na+/H+ or K+/H+ antiporter
MSPFVPPPANEAPYEALPPHIFPLRVKLIVCFWTYFRWQLFGLMMGPMTVVLAFLILHERYARSDAYRHFVWFMALFLIVSTGVIGLVAALWRYLVIQNDQHQNRLN